MPAPRRRRRLKRADREASLLDAAAKIVADEGVDGLTMEGLAARAGINKALPYRFFANRDAVLLALWERETQAFDAEIEAALAGAETLEDKLGAILGVWLDLLEAGGGALGRLEAPGAGPPELDEVRRERTQGVVDFLAELFRADYRISRQDAVTAAAALGAGAQGLAALAAHTGWPRKRLANTFVRLCIGALEAVAR
jgi:AcrR family transcriptional regulator